MKKIILSFLLILVLANSYSFGQGSNESSIENFMVITKFFITLKERENQTISKLEIDMVSDNGSRSTPVYLKSDQLYKVFLLGETGKIVNINLAIKAIVGDKWTILKEVNGQANSVDADFKATTNGFYEFEIKATKFSSGYTSGRYCLIISN